MKGKLIVFSGLDASGKSSNRSYVESELRTRGVDFALTREPGGTPFAEKIRNIILFGETEIPSLSEVLLFYAARIDNVEKIIKPYLEHGHHVLADRYFDSSLAYQSPICEQTKAIHDACVSEIVKPDLTLLYDVPVSVALSRLASSRGDRMDKIEKRGVEYFEKVRNNFLALANDDPNTIVIDATRPLDEVFEESLSHVLKVIEE